MKFHQGYKWNKVTSPYPLMLPPDPNCLLVTCVCLQKERNNKNVLKNILHMTNFTTWTFLLSKQKNTRTWGISWKGETTVLDACYKTAITQENVFKNVLQTNKVILQRKNVLENILMKLQMDKDDVTLSHSCVTASHGLSWAVPKGLEGRECLENILHLLKFTFWSFLLFKPQRAALVASMKCHTAVFQASTACIHVWTFFFASWKFQNVLRTFCKNKIHFFFILAHQATKARARGWILASKTQLFVAVRLQVSHLYKYKHGSRQKGSSYTQKFKKTLHTHKQKFISSSNNKPLNKTLSFLIIINKQTKIKQKTSHHLHPKQTKIK